MVVGIHGVGDIISSSMIRPRLVFCVQVAFQLRGLASPQPPWTDEVRLNPSIPILVAPQSCPGRHHLNLQAKWYPQFEHVDIEQHGTILTTKYFGIYFG